MLAADASLDRAHPRTIPYAQCLLIGLGGLFAGVTGPLLSTFIPPMVRNVLGDQRTAIGAVMAIDNVLLLILVPLAGALSDRAMARGGSRVPLVVTGFLLASAGMAVFPWSSAFGIGGIIAAMILLYTGINLQRSPFQALIADAVPSRFRSLATGSVTFQMCAGAIAFLMLGRILGMHRAYVTAAAAVIAIVLAFAFSLGRPLARTAETASRSLADAVWSIVRGAVPGTREVFLATVLQQLTFQSFTTWYALYAIERFGIRPEDVAIGFIAWALGGVIGALPAGFIGLRIGRRNALLLGFMLMAGSLLLVDRVPTQAQAIPLIALASASWTLPMVNAYPLFVEQVPASHRGVLAGLFLLSMALGGAIGDPLNGTLFDLMGGYRRLFLMMSVYAVLAVCAVLLVPKGAGEADTATSDAEPVGLPG
jgi:maltose/moltooligosaccharide transporter